MASKTETFSNYPGSAGSPHNPARYDLDDELITQCLETKTSQLDVYVPVGVSVILGRGSTSDIELNVESCLKNQVPVYKRDGGGCAVIIDPGNIIVTVVLPVGGIRNSHKYFIAITDWLIIALEGIGIRNVTREATSDLALDGRKVGGSCIHRTRTYLYYTTTLLINPDIELIERYLSHPPREPKYRRGRSHREFVGKLGGNDNPSRIAERLRSCLHLPDLIKSLPSQIQPIP